MHFLHHKLQLAAGDSFARLLLQGELRRVWRLPVTGIVKGGAVKLKHAPNFIGNRINCIGSASSRGSQVGSAYIGRENGMRRQVRRPLELLRVHRGAPLGLYLTGAFRCSCIAKEAREKSPRKTPFQDYRNSLPNDGSNNGKGKPRMSFRDFGAMILFTVTCVQAQPDPGLSIQTPQSGMSVEDRFRWVTLSTLGSKSLAAGVFIAGVQTWRDKPETYGTHWDGFAKRYGARLAAGGTSNALEASFGSLWGEDPRYYRAAGQPLRSRLGHVVKMAFVTHNRAGDPQLAYARFIAVPGGILVSNTWRPDSPSTVRHVTFQVGISFLSRIVGNTFSEFMPDLMDRKRNSPRNSQGP